MLNFSRLTPWAKLKHSDQDLWDSDIKQRNYTVFKLTNDAEVESVERTMGTYIDSSKQSLRAVMIEF